MNLPALTDLKNVRGQRVLVRVDFNVPIGQGHILNDARIKAAIPTIEWLIKHGAKIILMAHLGRPVSGKHKAQKNDKHFGLGLVAKHLSELLHKKVEVVEKWDFKEINLQAERLRSGEILILPNLRLHPGEERNSVEFAKELAKLGDYYIQEAFAVCHRKHASLVGIPKLLPAYAGLQLLRELDFLGRILNTPTQPLIVLIGGAKIADKIPVIKKMLKRAQAILVGGAASNYFFKAMGYEVGASKIESIGVKMAKELLGNKKIILPKDVVVGLIDGSSIKVVDIENMNSKGAGANKNKIICEKPNAIFDIGPRTILEFARYLKIGATLVWSGPMGLYEVKSFSHGTLALGRLFAARSMGKAFGIAGGGETVDALTQTGLAHNVDFVSTGGGAMLEFLGGKKLPAIEVLLQHHAYGQ